MSAVTEWFEARRDRVGTHSPECWKYHPDCAYLVGRAAAAQEIAAAYDAYKASGDDSFSYNEGYLDGLAAAEIIAAPAVDHE